jgi:hypothetical protein
LMVSLDPVRVLFSFSPFSCWDSIMGIMGYDDWRLFAWFMYGDSQMSCLRSPFIPYA